jgi:hypothetical protein
LSDTINVESNDVGSISDKKVMLGIFKNQKVTYFLVVNKSLEPVSNVQIGVKGVTPYVYLSPGITGFNNSTSLRYKRIKTSMDTSKVLSFFSIPQLVGGEGRLVRIR